MSAAGRRVLELLFVAGLGAVLVALSTVAAGRWGHVIGGGLSAFPLIVGPVLFVAARREGTAVAAQTAAATLLGLIALSGFAVAYARSARHGGWGYSLLVAWLAAAVLGALAGRVDVGLFAGFAAGAGSLAVALRALPPNDGLGTSVSGPRWELPMRMALTALLILVISVAGSRFGPAVAGALAALPTVASVLVVSTHARHGTAAVADLLHGMLRGMAAFVAFCALVGILVQSAGVAVAFVLASAAAVLIEGASASVALRRAAMARTAAGIA